MALPNFLQPYLASYDLRSLDPKRDGDLIITQVLNRGDDEAVRWLGENYFQKEIKQVISSPTRGMWMRSVLDYWLKCLGIKIPKFTYELALFSFDPRPELVERFFLEQEKKNKRYHQRLKSLGLNSF